MDEIFSKRSVECVRYVVNNLLHLITVKYGVISLVLCISTRLRLVTILTSLVRYLVIFHSDLCNKSYIYNHLKILEGYDFFCQNIICLSSSILTFEADVPMVNKQTDHNYLPS